MKQIPIGQGFLDEVVAKLQLADPLSREFLIEALSCAVLFDAKQQDYGPSNIAEWGEIGAIIRMTDKFNRIKTLATKGSRKVKRESIDDTLMDIANYAIITRLIRKGKWPGCKQPQSSRLSQSSSVNDSVKNSEI